MNTVLINFIVSVKTPTNSEGPWSAEKAKGLLSLCMVTMDVNLTERSWRKVIIYAIVRFFVWVA